MKTLPNILIALALLLSMTACGGAENKEAETGDAKEVTEAEGSSVYTVNSSETMLKWVGHKFDGSKHEGTFPVKSGEIKMDGDQIVGGSFVFDIANLTIQDLEEGTEEHGKLMGHLKSPDFFAAEEHPEGKFTIVSVKAIEGEGEATHEVTGNLMLRGNENSITFPAEVEMEEGELDVDAKTAIDRMKWDINWDKTNPAGDMIIKDMVDIMIDLEANPASES